MLIFSRLLSPNSTSEAVCLPTSAKKACGTLTQISIKGRPD